MRAASNVVCAPRNLNHKNTAVMETIYFVSSATRIILITNTVPYV